MYTVHPSAMPLKYNRLRCQVLTWPSTLASNSDQFRSSWRPGLNNTLRMRTGPSLQWKCPGRGSPPLQAPSYKPSLLSKLILAPAIYLYLATAFMSRRWDTKTVISSVYADTITESGRVKRTDSQPYRRPWNDPN